MGLGYRSLTPFTTIGLLLPVHPCRFILGVAGRYADTVVRVLRQTETWPIDGYLIVCPYDRRQPRPGFKACFRVGERHGAADPDL
jgi:hypothetical protein